MCTTESELQTLVADLVKKHQLPGAVASVWKDGQTFRGAAGVRNVNTGDPMTIDTSFITGSVTKVWTMTLLMTFVEEGLIDLDETIVRYAPDIQFGADDDIARSLTVKNLVNHSSGVDTGDLFVESRDYPDGVEDYANAIRHAGTIIPPNRWASYNNIGWIVAELVLRRVTGRNYHDLLTERILRPLDIPRTVLSIADAALHRTTIGSFPIAPGRHEGTPQLLYPSAWSAAGTTLITTVADTMKFLLTHLNGGTSHDGTRLLSEQSVDAMMTPTIQAPTGAETGFGLGWKYAERGRPRVVSHGGTSIGGRTFAAISPADNVAIASHVNSSAGDLFHKDLANLLLTKGSSPFDELSGDVRDDLDPRPFVGTYLRRAHRLDIELDGDKLAVISTPIDSDRIGLSVPATSKVTVNTARPTGPASIRVLADGPYQTPSDMTFYEESDRGFDLVYSGTRLARREGS